MRLWPVLLIGTALYAQQTPESLVLYEVRLARAEVSSIHSELLAIRATQDQQGAQIAINTGRINDLKTKVDGSELGILSTHVAALENEVKSHEQEDRDTKAAAIRDHDSYMRALEIGLSFITCGIGVVGAMVGISNRRHGKQLTEMREDVKGYNTVANNYAEKMAKVTARIDTEVARNDAMDGAQGVQDGRLDAGEGRMADLERRRSSG